MNKDFETADDITSYLREQFAGLMKQFFIDEQKYRETSIIKDINSTADTLKKLITFIQDTNQGNQEGLKEIIKTSHPIIKSIKNIFGIKYKFYIEKYEDLENLLRARGFYKDSTNSNLFTKRDEETSTIYTFTINVKLFDTEGNLIYYKPEDWKDNEISLKSEPLYTSLYDDLPF